MKNKNIIISAVALAVIIIGVVWYNSSHKTVVKRSVPNPANINRMLNGGLTTSASDTSDTALQNDLNSVNNQLNSLNTDVTNINQLINQ